MPGRSARTAQTYAGWAAAVALGYGAVAGVVAVSRLHTHAAVTKAARDDAVFGCLQRRLHHLVGDGTAISIGPDSSLYAQRLAEWAAPVLPVTTTQSADYVVVVRHVRGGPCRGLDVVASRRG